VKIAAIEVHWIQVPFDMGAPPRAFAGMAWTAMQSLFVRVATEDGLEGWGEGWGHAACAATRAALETLVAPAFIGCETTDVRALMRRMMRAFHLSGRSGPVMYALSAIDIALWDLAGKRAGLPLARLLCEGPVRELAAYASLLRYGEPTEVAKAVERALGRGYGEIKLHEVTVQAVRAARAAAPHARLTLDANCPWSADEAVAVARALAPYGLAWLEEPVWPPEDHAALARVRREGGIPTAAGENACSPWEVRTLIAAGAVDYVQPSAIKIGGVSAAVDCARSAREAGVRYVAHCAYFGPGYLASLHLAAAFAPDAAFERLFVDLEASPYHELVEAPGGRVRVPVQPGLGRDPDAAVLARYRAAPPLRVPA
jgi:L-alanine-DL-glutamate epimerase-like enolase superfamily enzyme